MMSDYKNQGPACDSGASSHFTPLNHEFNALKVPGSTINEEVHVEVASGHTLVSHQSALFALKSPDPRCKGLLYTRRAHMTEGLSRPLISVGCLAEDGYDTLFTVNPTSGKGEAIIKLRSDPKSHPVFIFPQEAKYLGKLYGVSKEHFTCNLNKKQLRVATSLIEKDRRRVYEELHSRLGHLATDLTDRLYSSLHGTFPKQKPICNDCNSASESDFAYDAPQVCDSAFLAKVHASGDPFQVFHDSMGHRSFRQVKELYERATGKKAPLEKDFPPCISCGIAKAHHQRNIEAMRHVTSQPIEMISFDLCGPFAVRSPFGHRSYFHAFVKHIAYDYVVPIKRKSEFVDQAIEFIVRAQRLHYPYRVAKLGMDNELARNSTFEAFLKSPDGIGIQVFVTGPGDSTQNGGAERGHRTLNESGQAGRHRAGLPLKLLIPSICNSANVLATIPKFKNPLMFSQSVPSRPLSPVEMFERFDAGSYKNLFQFNQPMGCLMAALKQDRLVRKGDFPGEPCINLGRSERSKCWLLYSLERHVYLRCVSVHAYPTMFPMKDYAETDPRGTVIYDSNHPLIVGSGSPSGGHEVDVVEDEEDDAESQLSAEQTDNTTSSESELKPPLAWKVPHIEESKLESTSRKLDFPSQPLTSNKQSDQLPVISEESEEEIIEADDESLVSSETNETASRVLRERKPQLVPTPLAVTVSILPGLVKSPRMGMKMALNTKSSLSFMLTLPQYRSKSHR